MKKNLISIAILGLLIVNIALTAVMMFSVVGASRKTAALVDNISTALDLELTAYDGRTVSVPMSDIDTFDISEKMTIPLKMEEDDQTQHYFIANITLSMDTRSDGYKEYGSTISDRESLIKSEITDAISQCTVDEARNNQDQIRDEILSRVQRLFSSDFVFNVSFSDTMVQ